MVAKLGHGKQRMLHALAIDCRSATKGVVLELSSEAVKAIEKVAQVRKMCSVVAKHLDDNPDAHEVDGRRGVVASYDRRHCDRRSLLIAALCAIRQVLLALPARLFPQSVPPSSARSSSA